MRAKSIKRSQNVDKATSTLQKAFNRVKHMTVVYQNALINRKRMASLNSDFIAKLKDEGRVTKEELIQFFGNKHENNGENEL